MDEQDESPPLLVFDEETDDAGLDSVFISLRNKLVPQQKETGR
jgi:hypothetical protein